MCKKNRLRINLQAKAVEKDINGKYGTILRGRGGYRHRGWLTAIRRTNSKN